MIKPSCLWSSIEAEVITGGESSAPWNAGGVSINPNAVQDGDLFFAAHGDDLERVMDAGAVAAIVPFGMKVPVGLPHIQVINTYEALRGFARVSRLRMKGKVIACQSDGLKRKVFAALPKKGNAYLSGAHMSASLANMNENAAHGVFGFSPIVEPDIAVIEDCKEALRHGLINMISQQCVVMISKHDAFSRDFVVNMHIKRHTKIVYIEDAILMDGLMRDIAQGFVGTDVLPISLKKKDKFARFRVKSVIQGYGRGHSMVLDAHHQAKDKIIMPKTISDMQVLYASKTAHTYSEIKYLTGGRENFEHVDIGSVRAGDHLVMRKKPQDKNLCFEGVLRAA